MIFLALLVMVEESDKSSAQQIINVFLFVPRICLAISTFHFLTWLEGPHEPDNEGRQS